MSQSPRFVDIHCHLLPEIDDGSSSWEQTLAMARIAIHDGTKTIIATPHQLGNYGHNEGDAIRSLTYDVQRRLQREGLSLQVLPGADVRIEAGMTQKILDSQIVTLADQHRHVLLELPHELYFPLEALLDKLHRHGMQGILSHPERNAGLLNRPHLLRPLVERGCLMQVTCGSLMGTFGPASQALAESMLTEGLVHFLASDAHGDKSRRPLMRRAFDRAESLVGTEIAVCICCQNPQRVVDGARVTTKLPAANSPKSRGWFRKLTAG